MKNKKNGKTVRYIIIGLGRFGQALCKELTTKSNCEVLAIDLNEEAVNSVKDYATFSAVADATDENVMKELGIKNFDVSVVCIGNDMESSILASLLCKQYGIEYVVCKAKSERHKMVLEKLGADLVIIPEYEMGRKIASRLLNPVVSEIFDLGQGFSIIEISVPLSWHQKTVLELNLRKVYNVNCLVIKREGEINANISGETVVLAHDLMVIVGSNNNLEKLSNKINA